MPHGHPQVHFYTGLLTPLEASKNYNNLQILHVLCIILLEILKSFSDLLLNAKVKVMHLLATE